jgi:hypothetical protein
MLTTPDPRDLQRYLRRILSPRWEFSVAADMLEIRHPDRGTPYRPPRKPVSSIELFEALQTGFAEQGVLRAACLPLRWGRETEVTISAVQALDPLLKDGSGVALRSGFLPQPVVRSTAKRDANGVLRDGFLTSFVNASRIEPIDGLHEYATVLDQWISVLSHLGFHARHISIHGRLIVWSRRQVRGVTLRFDHAGMPLGDIVLLWNGSDPRCMAVDLGTSLERLTWARTRRPWWDIVFGSLANAAPHNTLDAIRTATLLIGHGVIPSARGAGSITRRFLRTIPPNHAALGLSTLIRASHQYWSRVAPLKVPWTDAAMIMENEVLNRLWIDQIPEAGVLS